MRKNSVFLSTLIVFAVVLTLVAHLLPNPRLIYIFKPLATLAILFLALSNWRMAKSPYAFWISIGLCFSLLGDTLLLWPNRYFLPGLAVFLLTHLAYLTAFTRDAKFPARPFVWPLFLLVAACSLVALFPNLPNHSKFPVALYSVLLASMAAQAMGRSLLLKSSSARLAAIGAIFFMLSDLLLAFDHFHAALPLAPLLILLPYYLAQYLIAHSTASA